MHRCLFQRDHGQPVDSGNDLRRSHPWRAVSRQAALLASELYCSVEVGRQRWDWLAAKGGNRRRPSGSLPTPNSTVLRTMVQITTRWCPADRSLGRPPVEGTVIADRKTRAGDGCLEVIHCRRTRMGYLPNGAQHRLRRTSAVGECAQALLAARLSRSRARSPGMSIVIGASTPLSQRGPIIRRQATKFRAKRQRGSFAACHRMIGRKAWRPR